MALPDALYHKGKTFNKRGKEIGMLGYIAIFVGIVLFFLDVYFIYIALSFRKNKCNQCKGYLASTNQHKNHYVGGKSGRFYRHYLDYVYVYRVNGKEYRISGGVPGTKGNIRSAVDIIYQKNNPQFAYIDKLTFPVQPIIAILLFPLWAMIVICGIFLIV